MIDVDQLNVDYRREYIYLYFANQMVAEIAVGQKTNTQSSKQTNKEANKKE